MFKLVPASKPGSQRIAEVSSTEIFTREVLDRIGKAILEGVQTEIRKSIALQGGHNTPRGVAHGVPRDPAFVKSFSCQVTGQTIEILSTWPTAAQIVEGRRPYKMKWLTQEKGVKRVPMGKTSAGQIIIRTTPKTGETAWVHPGFRKHDFIEKGLTRAGPAILKIVKEQLRRKMRSRRYL